MNKRLLKNKVLSFLVFFFVASVSMHAQQVEKTAERKEAEELIKEVIKLYKSEKYNEALLLAQKAVVLSENASGQNSDLAAAALFNLAEIQVAKSKNKDAEATYDRYLAAYENVVGESDTKFTASLDRYVCSLIDFGRRTKALEIQKRIYKLDNKFDFAETGKQISKNMEMGGLSSGSGINLPAPTYLQSAKAQGISGSVVYKVNTDEKGEVTSVKTLCGHPLLVQGSEAAIRKAKYKPTIVAGNPVKVTFIAIYNFVL